MASRGGKESYATGSRSGGNEHGRGNPFKNGRNRRRFRSFDDSTRILVVHSNIHYSMQLEFIKIMEMFGDIERWFFNQSGNYGEIIYRQPQCLDNILSQNITFMGKQIKLKRKYGYSNYQKNMYKETQSPHKSKAQSKVEHTQETKVKEEQASQDFSSYTELEINFDVQVRKLVDTQQKSSTEIKNLDILYHHLENALWEEMPGCQIEPFGSTVTGLSLNDSDVDCFVHVPYNIMSDLCQRLRDPNNVHSIIVKNARRVLYRCKANFGNIVSIPNASIPIVKFFHKFTNVNCDLSFKGGFGIHNSHLILLFIESDARLHPLFFFIKYWAKHHKLIGHGKFTSYALCMLIIYYLQQLSPCILPSIKSLQDNCKNTVVIEHWDCSFDNNKSRFPRNENKLSLISLLQGFFELYSEFDYEKQIICPFTGKAYQINVFENIETFPPGYERYANLVNNKIAKPLSKNTNRICIQDPFVQSRNVASNIAVNKLSSFQQHCKLSFDSIKQSLESKNANELINTMLDQKVAEKPKKNRTHNYRITIPQVICFKKSVNFEYSEEFNNSIQAAFEIILRDVLKSEFQIIENDPPAKNEAPKWMLTYHCVIFYNVWYNRNRYKKNKDALTIEEDVEISNSLISAEYDGVPYIPLLSIKLQIVLNNIEIFVSVKEGENKSFEFHPFSRFFSCRFQKSIAVLFETFQ